EALALANETVSRRPRRVALHPTAFAQAEISPAQLLLAPSFSTPPVGKDLHPGGLPVTPRELVEEPRPIRVRDDDPAGRRGLEGVSRGDLHLHTPAPEVVQRPSLRVMR